MLTNSTVTNVTAKNGGSTVNVTSETISAKLHCEYCPITFTAKSSLDRHLKNRCKGKKALKEQERDEATAISLATAQEVASLKIQMAEMARIIQETAKAPAVQNNTNNLNVMCLGSKDNILDILVAKQGFLKALTMVKQSALGRLTGACTILQKAYFPEGVKPAIMHPRNSKSTYVYYDENNKRVVEKNSSIMAKKLADIIQQTYLKGMNCLKKDILGVDKTDEGQPYRNEMAKLGQVDLLKLELGPYDIQDWIEAVHELRDEKYQKRILKQLPIPFEDDY
jgi:hypothetical protein